MQTSRRLFMGTSAAVALATIGLTACATLNPNNTPQENLAQIASDMSEIASAFQAALPSLTALHIPDAATQAVADMQAVVQALGAAALTTTTAQSTVAKVETDVNAVVDAVAGLSIAVPAPLSSILATAPVLVRLAETALNMAVPASVAMKAAASGMSADEARAVLRLAGATLRASH